jgi:hypothetical protein
MPLGFFVAEDVELLNGGDVEAYRALEVGDGMRRHPLIKPFNKAQAPTFEST